jgi:hypothetical protein
MSPCSPPHPLTPPPPEVGTDTRKSRKDETARRHARRYGAYRPIHWGREWVSLTCVEEMRPEMGLLCSRRVPRSDSALLLPSSRRCRSYALKARRRRRPAPPHERQPTRASPPTRILRGQGRTPILAPPCRFLRPSRRPVPPPAAPLAAPAAVSRQTPSHRAPTSPWNGCRRAAVSSSTVAAGPNPNPGVGARFGSQTGHPTSSVGRRRAP